MKLIRTSLELGLLLGLLDACLVRAMDPMTVGGVGDVAQMLLFASAAYALVALAAGAVGGGLSARLLKSGEAESRRETGTAVACAAQLLLLGFFALKDLKGRGLVEWTLVSGGLVALLGSALVGLLVLLFLRLRRRGELGGLRVGGLYFLLGLAAFPLQLGGVDGSISGRKHVVLISIDTLRADHLGLYGYERATSPNIDELARGAVVFEEAFSSSHWTFPSHASLLTGLDPVALGALTTKDKLQPEYKTLAETLRENGWQTAAFVGGGNFSYISSERGLGQGFGRYTHAPYAHEGMQSWALSWISHRWSRTVEHEIGTATSQIAHVERWLKSRSDAPFFLFLHLFDVHSDKHRLPYDAPGEFRERFASGVGADFTGCHPSGVCASRMLVAYARGEIEGRPSDDHIQRMIDLYDGGIAYADAELKRFFDALEREGLSDSTTIVITSDHGEAFFEHGLPLHEDLHHENLHVPLILKDPDLAPRRIQGVVQNMDIVPTILELVGVGDQRPSGLQALLSGTRSIDQTQAYSASEQAVALTTAADKLIVPWDGSALESADTSAALRYQRQTDRTERAPLPGGEAGELVESLLRATEHSLGVQDAVLPAGDRSVHESSAEQRRRLRAIGYVD